MVDNLKSSGGSLGGEARYPVVYVNFRPHYTTGTLCKLDGSDSYV